MSSDASVTIDRLNCRFRMRPAPGGPFRVRDRFRAAIEREVPSACAAALAARDEAGTPVYRIRDVRIRVWAGAQTSDPGELARHCGTLLAAAIEDAMHRAPSAQAVRFASPAAYLTAFLRELADGRAWSRWYFKDFAPLRPLPDPVVAARLLVARPQSIAAVLLELHATGHAAKLIQRWGEPELGGSGPRSASRPDRRPRGSPRPREPACWRERPSRGRPDLGLPDATARARRALGAWLAFARADPEAAAEPAAGAVLRALVDLEAALAVEPALPEGGRDTLGRLATGPLADVAAWAGALLGRAGRAGVRGTARGRRRTGARADGRQASAPDESARGRGAARTRAGGTRCGIAGSRARACRPHAASYASR